MTTSHRHDWNAARARILERMAELRLDVVDLARSSGLSEKHVRTLLNDGSHVVPRDKTRWALCDALQWTTDSIDRILAGRDPIPLDPDDQSGEVSRTDLLASRLEEIEALATTGLEAVRQQQTDMGKFWNLLQQVEGDVRRLQAVVAELRRARGQDESDRP